MSGYIQTYVYVCMSAYKHIYFQKLVFQKFQKSGISVFLRNWISGNMEALKFWNFHISLQKF